MRTTLLCFVSSLTVTLSSAQTHFYIDQIVVQPSAPTTQDLVTIDVIGGLSSTGAYITSANADVVGNVIDIQIAAQDDGGLAVIVPHTESFDLGQLPAGNYSVTIDGQFVADLAPEPQHSFVVTGGGGPCSDLIIDRLQWSPFSDTALVVHVFNNSSELFDYPGFVLLASNGDTLALEAVDLFGIGQESTHTLRIHPDAPPFAQGSPVALHLWTDFFGEQVCTWDLLIDPCPLPCDTVLIALENFGSALTLGDFGWIVRNSSFEVVANGTFTLTTSIQSAQASLCLAPGSYDYECAPMQAPTGGQPFFGVRSTGWISGPSAPVVWSLPVPLSFEFLPACVDGTNNVPETSEAPRLLVLQNQDGLFVKDLDDRNLGALELIDTQGRVLYRAFIADNQAQLPLHSMADAVLLLRVSGTTRRVFWAR